MPTITSGSSVTLYLAESDSVLVANAANSEGTITVTRNGQSFTGIGNTLTPISNKLGPPPSSRVVGPFGIQSTVTISCTLGSVDYTVTAVGLRVLQNGQSAIPVLLPPSTGTNTISTAGVITLTGITLPTNYTGGLWVYLMAGDVVGGAEGLYFAIQTSNTTNATIQVKTNYQAPGSAFTPFIPELSVNAVGSDVALVDNSGVYRTLANITVPGGLMGANGAWRNTAFFTYPNNANNKTMRGIFGGSVIIQVTPSTTAVQAWTRSFRNNGVQNSNVSSGAMVTSDSGASSSSFGRFAINTAVDQAFTLNANISAAGKATDYIVLEGFTFEVLPG